MTRKEHVEWAKDRALYYLDEGQMELALSSMVSDMRKHEEAATQMDEQMMQLGQLHLHNNSESGLRSWIEGF